MLPTVPRFCTVVFVVFAMAAMRAGEEMNDPVQVSVADDPVCSARMNYRAIPPGVKASVGTHHNTRGWSASN